MMTDELRGGDGTAGHPVRTRWCRGFVQEAELSNSQIHAPSCFAELLRVGVAFALSDFVIELLVFARF